MNDFDTLRHDLRHEADHLTEVGVPARSASVHSRIRGVRRRRRGAAVGALALVMAATAGGWALRAEDSVSTASTPSTVLGEGLPASIVVGGFTYDFAYQIPVDQLGNGTTDVDLNDRDDAYVYSLVANGLGGGKATLVSDGTPKSRVFGTEGFAFPAELEKPADTQVAVTGALDEARVAVAAYRRTAALPPGVDDGTSVFRQTVGARDLKSAVFATPGASSVELTARNQDRFSYTCRSSRGDLDLVVDVDGEVRASRPCGDLDIDPARFAVLVDDGDLAEGRHVLTAALTHQDGSPAGPGEASFGLAIYTSGPSREVLDTRVERTVELDGRTYRLDRVSGQSTPGQPVIERLEPSTDDTLVGCVVDGDPETLPGRMSLDKSRSCVFDAVPQLEDSGLILAGDDADLTLDVPDDPAWRGALLFYVPFD